MGRTKFAVCLLLVAAAAPAGAEPPPRPPVPARPVLVHVQGGFELKPVADATIAPPEPMADRQAEVRARPAGSDGPWDVFHTQGRPCVDFLGGTEPWDVEVTLEGCRVARLGGVDADRTVVLERAAPVAVTVRLPEEFPVPAHPHYLTARLAWLRPPGTAPAAVRAKPPIENRHSRSAVFDARREVTLSAPEPGIYRIVVKAEAWHGLRREPVGIPCTPAPELNIPAGSPPLRLEVRPDAGPLEAFIRERK